MKVLVLLESRWYWLWAPEVAKVVLVLEMWLC